MHATQVHWLAQVSAVLGDMEKTAGTIRVSGSTAYVAQSAWIINDTVRGNITFGKPFDKARYDAVVEATSLGHDFKVQKSSFHHLSELKASKTWPMHPTCIIAGRCACCNEGLVYSGTKQLARMEAGRHMACVWISALHCQTHERVMHGLTLMCDCMESQCS